MRFCGRMLHPMIGAFTGQPPVFFPTRIAVTSASESFFERPFATRTSIGGSFGDAAGSALFESFEESLRAGAFVVSGAGVAAESLDFFDSEEESADATESRRSSPWRAATSTGTSQRVESVRLVSARASGD